MPLKKNVCVICLLAHDLGFHEVLCHFSFIPLSFSEQDIKATRRTGIKRHDFFSFISWQDFNSTSRTGPGIKLGFSAGHGISSSPF